MQTLTSKSQAIIPERVRRKLGVKPGDSVAFKFKSGQVYLQKARPIDWVLASAVEETIQDEWNSAQDERVDRAFIANFEAGQARPLGKSHHQKANVIVP
jgi:AbrB family looped-hinge helix DNA binding protein